MVLATIIGIFLSVLFAGFTIQIYQDMKGWTLAEITAKLTATFITVVVMGLTLICMMFIILTM